MISHIQSNFSLKEAQICQFFMISVEPNLVRESYGQSPLQLHHKIEKTLINMSDLKKINSMTNYKIPYSFIW